MKCPFCQSLDSRVVDSRLIEDGESIRRRRECLGCRERFTTYERHCETPLMVMKKGRRREPFNRDKLVKGIARACNKRGVEVQVIEKMAEDIEKEIRKISNSEISSDVVGKKVMTHLRKLDEVAYVRFASVYKKFDRLDSFIEEARNVKAMESEGVPQGNGAVNPDN